VKLYPHTIQAHSFVAESRYYFVNDTGNVTLSCPTNCPVYEVFWSIHLLSRNYNLTIYCHNNGTCINNNLLTSLLDITGDFMVASNKKLHFRYNMIYENAFISCVGCSHYLVTNGELLYHRIKGGM